MTGVTQVTASRALLWAGLFAHALFLPISIAGMQIALGAAAVGLLLHLPLGWRPRRTPLDLPLCALVAVALLSDLFSRYGPPPPLRSVPLLQLLLAWRVQAEALGGLDPETRRALSHKGRQRAECWHGWWQPATWRACWRAAARWRLPPSPGSPRPSRPPSETFAAPPRELPSR